MTCYKPLEAWYSKDINESGKRSLVFTPSRALQADAPIQIACGQCIGCRLERSRQWAMRCVHEASLYDNNIFLTLTFNDESLFKREKPFSLDVTEFQKFMKRLRKHFAPQKIRFFHCGEYGEQYGRPHYHAIIFNCDFDDKELYKVDLSGNRLFTSPTLSKLWPFGWATFGDVTFDSCAYVARYVMKKITGDDADEHYRYIDPDTGETYDRKPEYVTMSRRPGIGADWFAKYYKDVYPLDAVLIKGNKMQPPKYYDQLYYEIDPFEMEYIKDQRTINAAKHSENNTRERLDVRRKVREAKTNGDRLPRKLDKDS